MSIQITIVGLDRMGLSLGLALKNARNPAECIGFDLELSRMQTAEKTGAVDRAISNLHSAVEKADLVLLNLPAGDVVEWMNDISRSIKEGAVLINLAPVHSLACQWAADHLPANRSFINATPGISGSCLDEDESSSDLFREGIMLISSLPETDASAIQQVVDLAAILGCGVMFSDPVEADSLLSQTDLLPRLISLFYFQGITGQPGWPEAQKTTRPVFWQLSHLLEEFPSSKAASLEILAHKDNMLRMLDIMHDQIDRLQDEIKTGDPEQLEKSIQQTLDEHNQWVNRRTSGDWNLTGTRPIHKPSGIWKKLLGIDPVQKKS